MKWLPSVPLVLARWCRDWPALGRARAQAKRARATRGARPRERVAMRVRARRAVQARVTLHPAAPGQRRGPAPALRAEALGTGAGSGGGGGDASSHAGAGGYGGYGGMAAAGMERWCGSHRGATSMCNPGTTGNGQSRLTTGDPPEWKLAAGVKAGQLTASASFLSAAFGKHFPYRIYSSANYVMGEPATLLVFGDGSQYLSDFHAQGQAR